MIRKKIRMNRFALSACALIIVISAPAFLVYHNKPNAGWLHFLGKTGLALGSLAFILILLFDIVLGKERTAEILRNLAVLGITLALILPAAEFVVRFLYRDVMSTPDNRSYFCVHGYQHGMRLNSFGYREKEFERKKPKNVYRIAVIGDSFAFGQGIKEQERFSNLIGSKIHSAKRKFEVLNFGFPDRETCDHLATLKNTVLPIKPDFVLLQWFVNDFETHDKSALKQALPLVPSNYLSRELHLHSALYYLLNDLWQSIQAELGMTRNYAEYLKQHYGDESSPETQRAHHELIEFIRICKSRGVGVGLVLFPMFSDPNDKEYPFAFLHEQVIRICKQEDCKYLDLRQDFSSFKNSKVLWASRLDRHAGALANRVAADALIRVFGAEWLESQGDRTSSVTQK
jgi:multisubunit Na+/H+ antiporter MnhB subunit